MGQYKHKGDLFTGRGQEKEAPRMFRKKWSKTIKLTSKNFSKLQARQSMGGATLIQIIPKLSRAKTKRILKAEREKQVVTYKDSY